MMKKRFGRGLGYAVMAESPMQILLYYKYVPIADASAFAEEHLALCKRLGLKGRIIVAPVGINGTLSGTTKATRDYMQIMHADERFHDIVFKIDPTEEHVFRKLFVRAKPELVTFRLDYEVDPLKETGKYLKPREFYEALQEEGTVVIDARADYEYDIGHFRGAIRPDVRTFREFPQWIRENLMHLRDKRVLTYCTGGIRCETFTAFLMKEGFADVSQLEGGIVTYGRDPETKGKLFDGKCYVFDERIAVPVSEDAEVVGKCYHCGTPSERFVNCSNLSCHFQFLTCEACRLEHHQACSPECRASELTSFVA